MLAQIVSQLLHSQVIHSCSAAVSLHLFERQPHVLSFDHCFQQLLFFFRFRVLSRCRDASRTQAFFSPIPLATFRVGVECFSSTIRVSAIHRNLSLWLVTSCSGLRFGRMNLLCPLLTSATSFSRLSATVAQSKVADLPG